MRARSSFANRSASYIRIHRTHQTRWSCRLVVLVLCAGRCSTVSVHDVQFIGAQWTCQCQYMFLKLSVISSHAIFSLRLIYSLNSICAWCVGAWCIFYMLQDRCMDIAQRTRTFINMWGNRQPNDGILCPSDTFCMVFFWPNQDITWWIYAKEEKWIMFDEGELEMASVYNQSIAGTANTLSKRVFFSLEFHSSDVKTEMLSQLHPPPRSVWC